jgi:RNA polymerase sigma factor (sigma-70 family)
VGAHAGELVRAAADGDQHAWDELVERFTGLVWSVIRAYRMGPADGADVNQVVWLRLVENLDHIRDPERVGSWLATVARRECVRLLRRSGREVAVDDVEVSDEDTGVTSDLGLLTSERDRAIWQAFERLPPQCRALLRVLMADPRPSYDEVAAALEMPIGSIGPTRQRCLDRLRRSPEVASMGRET